MSPYAWTWDVDALVLVPLLLAGYALALRAYPASRARVAAFLSGLVLILAAFVTPLGTISLHYLLSAHLLQNVILAEWAPALCVLGLPPALAASVSRLRAARALVHPLVALPLWLATYFLWHLPWVYDAALEHQATLLHLEHGCYFAAGVLFWWPVLHDRPGGLSPGGKAAYLFAAFVLASPLGLLLALLPSAIYDFYLRAPRLWGLSPLTDQQIAGLTMAAEQAVVLFAFFVFFLVRFLRDEERAEVGLPGRGTLRS
jgi:putative membrane protein